MQFRIQLLLIALATVAAVVYWQGLGGGFWFDDYGGLVINEGVRMSQFSWPELIRGAWSYAQSGPLGRPISMATFTFDYWLHGLNPWWAKLENVIIHLVNGGLIFVLSCQLLRQAVPSGELKDSAVGASRYLALFATGWWVLNPMAITSVLYVIQRMTSLAATFTLLGLVGYLQLRSRGRETGRPKFFIAALFFLVVMTLASAYTKESGALTIAYAWVIEIIVLSRSVRKNRLDRLILLFCRTAPILVVGYFFYFLVANPDWLYAQVPGRDFSRWQRFLTELRIIIQYLKQIIFPDTSWFALYHDDIPLSFGVTIPEETAWSGFFHLITICGSIALAKRMPLVAFGIIWFYVGHSLESSVFPLELAHEHRNYLPMFGILLAASALISEAGKYLKINLRIPAVLLLGTMAGVTAVRADIMGDSVGFYLHQAHNHPMSSRSNYDAAMILIKEIRAERLDLEEAAPRIKNLLDISQKTDPNALAPLLGKLTLATMRNQRSEETLNEFATRLEIGVPPAAIYIIVVGLMELVQPDNPALGVDDMERLLKAALRNPALGGISRGSVLSNYGMLLSGMKQDFPSAREKLAEALKISPNALEVRLHYAGLLLEMGDFQEAGEQLRFVKRNDVFGYHKRAVHVLEEILSERVHGIQE